MRLAQAAWMTNEPHPSPAMRTPDVGDRDRLRDLLERLTYTRTEPQRQVLLAQVRDEIQEIRKLTEF
jgi:hypothetical protein